MIVSHRYRLIFFAFPKTGSESLRALLAPLNEVGVRPWRAAGRGRDFHPHMSPAEARAAFARRGWDFAAYRRVTCLRNPYPRLVSLYRMIRAVDGVWRLRARAGLGVPGFAAWLRASPPRGRGGGGRAHQRWRRHGTWSARAWIEGEAAEATAEATGDAAAPPLVTHVLRLEHLAQELPALWQQLGLPPPPDPLPWLNSRPPAPWQAWYDPPLRHLVARRYRWELARFYPGEWGDG